MIDQNIKTNRLKELFGDKPGKEILSVYYSAGFPDLNDTVRIAIALEKAGADVIEIGMPFSDPVADGPTIQESNKVALDNGMTLKLLFQQLKNLRDEVSIPVILMGYINPVMQYGIEQFCKDCEAVGIDGLILPDLPLKEYNDHYRLFCERHGLKNIFLISPQTSDERIRMIDENSDAFIYMVSSTSITGKSDGFGAGQESYFKRIEDMALKNPRLIGFGISNKETFEMALKYSQGAIIGSAFIRLLKKSENLEKDINQFVNSIKS